MVIGAESGFNTLFDVIPTARAKPGSVAFANYAHHYRFGALSLEKITGATFNHVKYKDAAQVNNHLRGDPGQ